MGPQGHLRWHEQFMVIQVFGLIMIMIFPQIALWLPELIYGKGHCPPTCLFTRVFPVFLAFHIPSRTDGY
jgi:hypothetical protein